MAPIYKRKTKVGGEPLEPEQAHVARTVFESLFPQPTAEESASEPPLPTIALPHLSDIVDETVEKTELIRKIESRQIFFGYTPSPDPLSGMDMSRLRALAKSYGVYHAERPKDKCVHGVLTHFRHYCEVCAWERIDPKYNAETYRKEVKCALKNAKVSLSKHDDGHQVLADIQTLADIEIWKATKKYGSDMNAAIAYSVARNTAQKFMSDFIDAKTILVGLDLEFATDADRTEAERLLQQCGDIQGLERLAKDDDANKENRNSAKDLIRRYGNRVARETSFDVKETMESGDEAQISVAELELNNREMEGRRSPDLDPTPDIGDAFEDHLPALQALVATWRGDQRKVGEAMLAGGFNVRNVPGVSKSQASRLYSVVVRAFKALITKGVTK